MTNVIWLSPRRPSNMALNPEEELRSHYPPPGDHVISYWFLLFKAALTVQQGAETGCFSKRVRKSASDIRANFLGVLVENIDLVGLEYRNARGKLIWVIQAVIIKH
jgi:hypothetical protein